MPTVAVKTPTSSYDVQVSPGLLSSAGMSIRSLNKSTKICVLTDSNVGPIYLPRLTASLQAAGFKVIAHTLPAGENFKTIDSIAKAYDAFLSAQIDRQTPIVALGGGVIGDMTGFVAATILRGVPFVQIPTTLLSAVDASVGGKTGIDHAAGKNLIGAFHQPIVVLIDPEVLATLPERELRSGLAECIKHDIIRDGEHFKSLPAIIDRALKRDIPTLTDWIVHNVKIKAAVVEADPFEKGERAHLNFGHTFGHAIELISKFEYSHGQSIAYGMLAASWLAEQLKMITPAEEEAIEETVRRTGLVEAKMNFATEDVYRAMFFDKKTSAGKLRLILPDKIGHVVIRDDVEESLVRKAIDSLR